ncbi:hypothetical protein [Pseudomonas pseudonitroreducens]|uniref:hypothetical protein n=1 Tax=Pseudomonas pseudonitroreducens TaxID=2892326 RepID=UPI001F20897B|nr:hypothetical protein [Pseudomonas pseudonitroreducens]
MWVQIVIIIASYIISTALAPKPKSPKAPAFEDFDFPLSEEGGEKSAVFGQCWTPSWTVLTVGNYRTKAIRSKGGKK